MPAGTWLVRLHAREIRDGRYHAWIERDDPQRLGRIGEREAWSFPSFFTERTLVDDSTVSSLGWRNRVITVANLDEVRNRISISSSQGPTRDGREKPDIAAPGTDIVAAKGFAGESDQWVSLSGHEHGEPVRHRRRRTDARDGAAADGGADRSDSPAHGQAAAGRELQWSNDAGFGVIDPEGCLAEAQRVNIRKDLG